MPRIILAFALLAAVPAFAQSPQNPLQYYLYQESGGYAPPALNQAPVAPQGYDTGYTAPQDTAEPHPYPIAEVDEYDHEQINQGVQGMNLY